MELLPCPLCTCPHFKDAHSLRTSLVNVATAALNCPVCNETVKGLDKLTIHLFSHINEIIEVDQNQKNIDNVTIEQKPIMEICDICNFSFTDKTILELHQKLLHQNNSENPRAGAGQNSNLNSNFHCHLCSKKFRMKGSLIVHLRVAHYGFSNENKLEKSAENSNRTEQNKQWECDVCSKMFTTKYFLKKHKRLHTGEMPYTCTQCNRSFTFQQSYHKHMLYHSSEKPHICNECGRAFKELSTLQNHARIHSGERPFACENCGKRFRQRVSYLVHRRIHTGVMPYDCKNCGKKFRYKVSLRSHKCTEGTSSVSISTANTAAPNVATAVPPQIENNFEYGSQNDGTENVTCILSMNHDGSISLNKKIQEEYVQSATETCDRNFDEDTNILEDFNSSSPDLYSMLSPLLPEVESLCLSRNLEENQAIPTENFTQLCFQDANVFTRN